MLVRYAATFGRGAYRHSLIEKARALGLTVSEFSNDFLFVCSPRTPHVGEDGSLLVGRAFSKGGPLHDLPSGIGKFADRDFADASSLWGNFALFLASPGGAQVYRDPSAGVPVYRIGSDETAVFVSDGQLAFDLDLLVGRTADLTFAIHWLQFPFLRSFRTGAEGVSELLPGSLDRLERTWTQHGIWSPSRFLKPGNAICDPLEAARKLREAALGTVPLQVEGNKVLLQLSGGLDSSIVAACLASSGQSFQCVNFATRSPEGDERSFARTVAAALDRPLFEIGEPEPCDLPVSTEVGLRPATNPLLRPFDEAISNSARDIGADLLVDGAGGDNLFCHISSAAPVLDALFCAGIHEAIRTAGFIATRSRSSWWEVARAAAKRSMNRPSWKEDRSFLSRESWLPKADVHPWLEGLADAPPGKREHVAALVHIQHFLDRRGGTIPFAHPLLAQPLLELCLRIPSWLWMGGGRDRAIARNAFAELLPPLVVQRRGKGSLQSLFYRSFARQRAKMLDLLMSGVLRASNVLDAAQLETCLGSRDWMRHEVQLRISEMVALELWLQAFNARPKSVSNAP